MVPECRARGAAAVARGALAAAQELEFAGVEHEVVVEGA